MFREYGLEPSLLNNWNDFRYFTEKFGFSKGRLISRYPKHWKRLVYESLSGCGDIDRKRITERLVQIDSLLLKRSSQWNNAIDWLGNARIEHSRQPFHAIIARDNPHSLAHVLEADSLTDENPLWQTQRCLIIPRTPQAISNCASILFRSSSIIKLIDPYFSPKESRYRESFEALFSSIPRQISPTSIRVEIHTKSRWESTQFKALCESFLPAIIPANLNTQVIEWDEFGSGEKLHNRFILTDRGGLAFGAGLDATGNGQTDEVHLLDTNVVQRRLTQYSIPSHDFRLVGTFSIVGTKAITA